MFKKFLMGAVAFAFTASASAADITNPFYLPTKGQVGSITSATYHKNNVKNGLYLGNSYDQMVSEQLQLGITDSFALTAGVGNTFNKLKYRYTNHTPYSDKTDTNVDWMAGFGWNLLNGPARFQLNASYNQGKMDKSVYMEAKTGYQFKKFLPYVSVADEISVEQNKTKPNYNAKLGVYQGLCEVWALDTGIRWVHSEEGEERGYNTEVEASYYLTPKSAVTLYGTYLLDGQQKYEGKIHDKTVGVKLRWFFN